MRPAGRSGAARDRARRRTTIELAVVVGLLALATGLLWVDATWPTVLPVAQAAIGVVVPVLAAFVAVLALGTRHRLAAAGAIGVLAVHLALAAPWFLPGRHATTDAGPDRLLVMAVNVQYGRADTRVLRAEVRSRDVDVLVLTEMATATRERTSTAFRDLLPHVAGSDPGDVGGTAIHSRHPFRADPPAPPDLTFDAPSARIAAPGGDIRVVAAHMPLPFGPQAQRWRRDLQALRDWATDVPAGAPLVVAGDLNATHAHPALRALGGAGLVDAHHEAGAGYVATWMRGGTLPPLFHIDHVLIRDVDVTRAGVLTIPGTDHDAVWAELAAGR